MAQKQAGGGQEYDIPIGCMEGAFETVSRRPVYANIRHGRVMMERKFCL
jgi:hypothetical protein